MVWAASLHDIGALSVKDKEQLFEIDVENPEPHEIKGEQMLMSFKPFSRISKIIRYHHVKYNEIISGIVDERNIPIKELEDILDLAANHHEKHDQSGYPLKMNVEKFTIQMDVLAFDDIFSALSEDRPYRKRMNPEMMKLTLATFTAEKLSEDVCNMIISNFDELLDLTNTELH